MPFFKRNDESEETEGVFPCPACHGARRKIKIVLLADAQEWWCEKGHVVIMDRLGKKYLSTQNPKDIQDWRTKEDWKRTDKVDGQEVTPQARAWHDQHDVISGEIPQRMTKKGWNWQPGDDNEGKKKGKGGKKW